MNREIKFRAWVLSDKEMWNVETLYIEDEYVKLFRDSIYGETKSLSNNHTELMQFTGLSDKNGKEIYEGDIVNFDRDRFSDGLLGVISFYESAFRVNKHIPIFNLCNHDENTEVIGNIYQNPELIK